LRRAPARVGLRARRQWRRLKTERGSAAGHQARRQPAHRGRIEWSRRVGAAVRSPWASADRPQNAAVFQDPARVLAWSCFVLPANSPSEILSVFFNGVDPPHRPSRRSGMLNRRMPTPVRSWLRCLRCASAGAGRPLACSAVPDPIGAAKHGPLASTTGTPALRAICSGLALRMASLVARREAFFAKKNGARIRAQKPASEGLQAATKNIDKRT
jgi:hypothetical protein